MMAWILKIWLTLQVKYLILRYGKGFLVECVRASNRQRRIENQLAKIFPQGERVKTIEGIAMVADKVDANGNLYTSEAIKGAIKSFKPCKITYNFNPYMKPQGEVTKIDLEGNNLMFRANMKIEKPFLEKLAIVPSFKIEASHKEGEINIIDKAIIFEMALTTQPADKEASKFKF